MTNPPPAGDVPIPDGPFWPRKRANEHPNLRFVRYVIEDITPWQVKDPSNMGIIFAKWIGALASVLTIAYDGLIDGNKIKPIGLDLGGQFPFDFPTFPILQADPILRRRFTTLHAMLRFLRNAFAHGNIELLPGFLSLGMWNGGMHIASGVDYVAIAIWNGTRQRPHEQRNVLYLAYEDVVDLVFATAKLCEAKEYWRDSVLQWSQQDTDSYHGLQASRGEPLVIVQGEPFRMPFAIYEPRDIEDDPDQPQ
jgi:hypothetical protein